MDEGWLAQSVGNSRKSKLQSKLRANIADLSHTHPPPPTPTAPPCPPPHPLPHHNTHAATPPYRPHTSSRAAPTAPTPPHELPLPPPHLLTSRLVRFEFELERSDLLLG